MSHTWSAAFRLMYRVLAVVDPLVRAAWRRVGVGNVVELRVARRNGQGTRSRMVGVLRAGGRTYLGHPNGHVGWTRDLEAAGEAGISWSGQAVTAIAARRLANGPEREAAIAATGQHPFPGNLVYRLGRRHVRATGVYFRITTIGEGD